MGFCWFLSDRQQHSISNSPYRGSYSFRPSQPVRTFAHTTRLAERSPRLAGFRTFGKVSGWRNRPGAANFPENLRPTVAIFRFWEFTRRDRVRSHCRPGREGVSTFCDETAFAASQPRGPSSENSGRAPRVRPTFGKTGSIDFRSNARLDRSCRCRDKLAQGGDRGGLACGPMVHRRPSVEKSEWRTKANTV